MLDFIASIKTYQKSQRLFSFITFCIAENTQNNIFFYLKIKTSKNVLNNMELWFCNIIKVEI